MQKTLSDAAVTTKPSSEGRQTASLDSPGTANLIASRIKNDINDYAIRSYYQPHRSHLGASEIGHECSRYLWYKFRWIKAESGRGETPEDQRANQGRMQRLFNRGHLEEKRYVEFLTGVGFKVLTEDPDTGKQFVIGACKGHMGGSCDGVAFPPERYGIDTWLLLEFKTNSTGQGFDKLVKEGLNVAKQQHFTQTSVYGTHLGLSHYAYFNTNKNDDDMYVEVGKINTNLGQNMIYKAERIITSPEPPPKLALDPKFQTCSWCVFKGICHGKERPEMNCRSCVNASPVDDGAWFCSAHNAVIPKEYIPQGCPTYKAIV